MREVRAGVTLIELMAAIFVLSLLAGLAGMAFRETADTGPRSAADSLRAVAVEEGRVVVSPSGGVFLPDGRAVGPGLDPVTGAGS